VKGKKIVVLCERMVVQFPVKWMGRLIQCCECVWCVWDV